jgi:hypothetical protein
MDKLDFVDQIEFVKQNGTGEPVEIAARDKPEFFVGHASLPKTIQSKIKRSKVPRSAKAGSIGVKLGDRNQG